MKPAPTAKGRGCGCGGGISLVLARLQSIPGALAFAVLALQTCIPLLIRHTRKQDPTAQTPVVLYHPASVTLFAEVTKCLGAFLCMYRETREALQRQQQQQQHRGPAPSVQRALVETGRRFLAAVWRLSALLLPAAMYFASNLTAMHALSHLRSYIFTAVMNARIVFAALLSMLLMNKRVSGEQWRAIIIIVCAATVLCLEDAQTSEGFTMTEETMGMVIAMGTAAVSAAGGVLVEKYLAQPPPPAPGGLPVRPTGGSSDTHDDDEALDGDNHTQHRSMLWEQQGVLALFSAAFADVYVLLFLQHAVRARELLAGWTFMTVIIMFLQSLQGILVACAINRWGIVFRLILGTISICLCIIAEGLLFLEPVVFREVLSIILVMLGSSMYYRTKTDEKEPPLAMVCKHCGRRPMVQGLATAGEEGGEGIPGTESHYSNNKGGSAGSAAVAGGVVGTRLRRHSPTPLEEKERKGRRWW